MFLHVTNAKYIGDYQIWLSFNDGAEGKVDLSPELHGEVFNPLKDKEFFSLLFLSKAILFHGATALILRLSFYVNRSMPGNYCEI